MNTTHKLFLALASSVLASLSCTENQATPSPDVDAAPPTQEIKIASSWNGAADLQALHVVLAAFTAETTAVINVIPLAQDATERTAQFQEGDWELGQENLFRMLESFDDGIGGLTSLDLDEIPKLEASLSTVFPEIAEELSVGGTMMGFPMNVHRENTLIYAKTLVATPPTTLDELVQVCTDYVDGGRKGPRPMAIATADWINRIVFQSMLPASILGGSKSTVNEQEIRGAFEAALDVLAYYYANDCFYVAPSEHGWDEAAQALVDGEAAMFIHGDWAKGYMTRLGSTPGTDFDVQPSPGSHGAFHYGVDTFSVNQSSENRELAIEFARIALTPAVQVAFSEIKGSTPAVEIPNEQVAIDDAALLAAYNDLNAARDAGTFVAVPSWLADNAALIVPITDASKTSAEVAADFYVVYPE